MLDELEKIARYDYDGFKHSRKCKCWYVYGLHSQEKYVSCIQYIRRTRIPIKYGDVVVYADMSSGKYLEPYYYGQKNIFIYDGVNLLAAKKYYSGRFKIWELHPTTGIFIGRDYWSDVFLNSVYFDHSRHTIIPLNDAWRYLTKQGYRIIINKRDYYIYSKYAGPIKKNQQFKYYIDTPDNMIMIWDY